jgi:flavin-dependent dehydrogenase
MRLVLLSANLSKHSQAPNTACHQSRGRCLAIFVIMESYREFQRWKHHPEVSKHLEGGRCIQYGARALNEGGYHAIPKLTFPGGALLGCSAGFLNSVKIKGTHTSMKSGIVAGEAVFDLLTKEDSGADSAPQEATEYQNKMETSWVSRRLHLSSSSSSSTTTTTTSSSSSSSSSSLSLV